MFYSIFVHRKSRGAKAANWHHSTKVEVLWTVIPFAILIAVAVPATKSLIMMEDVSNADMIISDLVAGTATAINIAKGITVHKTSTFVLWCQLAAFAPRDFLCTNIE
jgi:heme/copper-type cytochrome/quinol oxidase subunit 2